MARAGSHDAESRFHLAARRLQAPPRALPRHARHARFFDLRPRPLGPLQQHAVQIVARINHQRVARLQRHLARLGRCQHALRDHPLRGGILNQKRILAVCFMRQRPAARLFPGELLIIQNHAEPGRCQLFRRVGPRRTATQDCDSLHFFFLPAGGRSSRAGILPPAPGAAMPPPCGLSAPGIAPPCGEAPGGTCPPPCWPASCLPTTVHLLSFSSRWYWIAISPALAPFGANETVASALSPLNFTALTVISMAAAVMPLVAR